MRRLPRLTRIFEKSARLEVTSARMLARAFGLPGKLRSSYQTRTLRIEFPSRNQELHRCCIVATTQPHTLVKFVRVFDLRHVGLNAESRSIGNVDGAVHNLQRLFGQSLPVLPNPMCINSSNFSRCGGGNVREHCERDVEMIIRVRAPSEPAPIAA